MLEHKRAITQKPYENRFPWNLDWNLLRTFMVVASCRSLTSAANQLGLKQPTISSAMKRLEDHVGQPLIMRNAHHFSLTEAGERLQNDVNVLFDLVSEIPASIENSEKTVRGHVIISMASHVVSPHWDALISKFALENPAVSFSVSVNESIDVLEKVRQNRVSFGICLLSELPNDLKCEVLFQEKFRLYCGRSHPLFNKPEIKVEDLKDLDIVAFQTETEGAVLRPIGRLRERAMTRTTPRAVSANLSEVRRMIISGIGIGALPEHVAITDVERGFLRPVPPFDNVPTVSVYFIRNPKRHFNSAEAQFVRKIEHLIASTPLAERIY